MVVRCWSLPWPVPLRLAVLMEPPAPHQPPRAAAAAEPTLLGCENQPCDTEGLGEARVASKRLHCCCHVRPLRPRLKINTRDSGMNKEILGSPHRQEEVCASLRSHRKLGGRAVWGTMGLWWASCIPDQTGQLGCVTAFSRPCLHWELSVAACVRWVLSKSPSSLQTQGRAGAGLVGSC